MKLKYIYLFLFIVSITPIINSYAKKKVIPLDIEDLIPGGKTFAKYRPVMPKQISWYKNELDYVKGDSIVAISSGKTSKKNILTTIKDINLIIAPLNDSIKSFVYPNYKMLSSGHLYVKSKKSIYIIDFLRKEILASFMVKSRMSNIFLSSDEKILAYTKNNNLYFQLSKQNEKAITSQENENIISGQAVHRNEFGITKGIFFAPNNNLLGFYHMDQTMVTDYPLVDVFARSAKLNNIKYPMAGMKSHQVTFGIYNLTTNKTVYLKTGLPKDKYLTNVTWSPDSKHIYIAELNRDQDSCALRMYNAQTGNIEKTLFTETDTCYVEPQHPILFVKNDSTHFIWQSLRDGHNHLYMYDLNGKLISQLTKGHWDVLDIIGFDHKAKNLYFMANISTPLEKHIYKLNLATKKIEKLSKEQGIHNALVSANGRYLCDIYTSQYNPGKIALIDGLTNSTHIVYEAKNPFSKVEIPEIILGKIKADDEKTILYYRLVKPLNFDPTKRYPTIIYVYGGPHSQLVDNSWMAQVRGWDIYMAERGYVVFTLDNRGTANRGSLFEHITHRRLGLIETKDQMKGVDFLKSLPYVDSTRMGVHGWSFGGFMTLNLMLRHPDTFKVAVAGGPVTDWKYYEIMYGERYMDTPQQNPQGYTESSMILKAANLKGRLLIIHGDKDNTVVPQNSFMFLESCIKNNTQPDFFIYPGQMHNMVGRDRIHLHEKITRYFDDFL